MKDSNSPPLAIVSCLFILGYSVGLSAAEPIRYVDVTSAVGIDFQHTNGRAGEGYVIEVKGSGIALVDYDNDDDLDIYAVNGNNLPGGVSDEPPVNRLYRNDGDGTFVDVTFEAGAGDGSYGHGVTAADYDNDGDQDLYILNYGPNVLLRNDGDGTFTDVSESAGVAGDLWSVSGAFCDLDNDGLLDLYVANYLDFDIETDEKLPTAPIYYDGQPDALYLNNGDGSFRDVTSDRIGTPDGKGLGIVCFDHDNDGDLDLYVANDGVENFLFENKGDARFDDITLLSGTGVNGAGETEAGMGVDAGDFDADGDLDLFVTNYKGESNTLMRNEGGGIFTDVTAGTNLMSASLPYVAFGTGFFDPDNDGDLDIYIANGHTQEDKPDHAQPDQLFVLEDNGRYSDASASSGPPFRAEFVGRGVAFGDFDNDGDVDLVVSNKNGPLNVLQNAGQYENNWIAFKTRGHESNRDGIGARITVTTPDATYIKEVKTGYSMFSSSDPRVYFGLGDADAVQVDIAWPSGQQDQYRNLPVNRLVELQEGADDPLVSELRAIPIDYVDFAATSDVGDSAAVMVPAVDLDELGLRLDAGPLTMEEYAQLGAAFRGLTKRRGIELYDHAVSNEPVNAEFRLAYGSFVAYHEEFELAADQIAKAVKLDSKSIRYQRRFASASFDLGRHEPAVRAARAAIALGDDSEAAYLLLARSLAANSDAEAAAAELRSLLERYPASAAGHLELGNLYADDGDLKKAENSYVRAIRSAPDNREARYRLAEVYRRQGDDERYEREIKIFNLTEAEPESLAIKADAEENIDWLCRDIRINPLLVQTRTGLELQLKCAGLGGSELDELYSLRTQVSVLSREMAQDLSFLRRAYMAAGSGEGQTDFAAYNEARLKLDRRLHEIARYDSTAATTLEKDARTSMLDSDTYDDVLIGFKSAMLADPGHAGAYHGLIQFALLTGIGLDYALVLAQRVVLIDQAAKSYDLLVQTYRVLGEADLAEDVRKVAAVN